MSNSKLSKEISDKLAIMMSNMSSSKAEEYDSNQLSDIQKEIVKSTEKDIIVVAGAGSGKTRVLTERIKYLIKERNVSPSNIVSITFTNMAADEMRERLSNVEGIGDAFIGTIHSFANRIYHNSGSNYQIFTDSKDNEFHKYLIDKYCTNLKMDRYLKYKDMKVLVDQGRLSESDLNDFFLPSEKYELSMIEMENPKSREFPETIRTLMTKYNVITFDQLIKEATRYFKSIDGKLEYLLVDEFQDIGSLEYNFIKSLTADNNFYVGDDWQSIYGFKGGNVKIFKNIIKNNKFKVYYLLDNYRNSKEIIDVSMKVINQVSDRIDKEIVCKSTNSGKVIIDSKFNIRNYLDKIKSTKDYKDWFILVRTNRDIANLSDLLSEEKVPFSTFKKADMSLAEMRLEMDSDTVKLLTVHTSKGLESKNVMIVGNFPIIQPFYLRNSDERKVLYVGITRCEQNLIILN